MSSSGFGIGAPVRRKEDERFITGRGNYVADIQRDDVAQAVVVRSSVAHARFSLEGLDDARAMPGVIDIITAKDTAHLGNLPTRVLLPNRNGTLPDVPAYPILSRDTVRHVGEAVAMVVAETEEAARAASEMIYLDYEEIPLVIGPRAALQENAPLIWPERGTNVAFDSEFGDEAAADMAFAQAKHIVKLDLVNNRTVTNFMETRGAIGEYEAQTSRYTLTVSSQGVHLIHPILADDIFHIERDRIRVITPDVGGGFGTKYFTYREYALVLLAAKRAGRPIRWIADRLEHFVADYHGRDHVSHAELALDEDFEFVGLRVDTVGNVGAFLSQVSNFIIVSGVAMTAGCYRTPAAYARVRGVYTNSVPVDAYRGAGRPEAAYLIERLVDKAALELGLAPEELRRRNFVSPQDMPFSSPFDRTCDSGDFDTHMTAAMGMSDWNNFEARLGQDEQNGLIRGHGMATYIEACAGGGPEHATVSLRPDGTAEVFVGSQSSGQGHETAYAQLVSEHLDINPANITVVQGDTDRILRGTGTGGSRSIPVGGSSVALATERLAKRVKDAASEVLEAATEDLEFVEGNIRIRGTDRAMPLGDAVARLPPEQRTDLEDWQPPNATFPNGTHIAEVVIDPETGSINIEKYVVVDDFGVTLNPIMLDGQIHGGVVQGIGQAVMEHTVYDLESGQLLTASLMDYCLPRASDVPMFEVDFRNVPCVTNALGMKGAGEAGAIGSCPAIVNAVVDALHRSYGITHIDMPMTPQRVWQAIHNARSSV